MLGRAFLAEEDMPGKAREVILSYGLWKRRYGADAAIVGQTIKVDGDDFTVVGVMPLVWGGSSLAVPASCGYPLVIPKQITGVAITASSR